MTASVDSPLSVIHSVDVWLGRTLAWLYALIDSLPEVVESQVLCASIANRNEFPIERLHCYSTDGTRLQNWLAARSWRYQMRRKRTLFRSIARTDCPVIVHSHFAPLGWFNLPMIRTLGVKHVVSFYGYDVDRLPQIDPRWRDRYLQLFSQIDAVLCEGPQMIERVIKLGCPQHKVHLHHLGVDVNAIPFKPRTWQAHNPLRVLLASAFFEKKGLPYAIEALARVRKRVPLQVSLVGDEVLQERSRQEKQRILDTIHRCGMNDVVKLYGFVPHSELIELAYQHHLFVVPSITTSDGDNEGGAPMSLPLMAATGMPIVSTLHRDIPHVVLDGVTGRLAAERDVGGLADCIEWFAANPGKWNAMVNAGRGHIESEFNTAHQGPALAAIYRQVAEHRPIR